jgi:hypothetical protein
MKNGSLTYYLIPLPGIALLLSLFAGWERMGILLVHNIPAAEHGAMMIGCFLGGLIMLERAAALRVRWSYLGTLISGIGLFLFLFGENTMGYIALIVAALAYILMLIYTSRIQKTTEILWPLLGALCLLTGNILLLVYQLYPLVIMWWMCFLLFTILGEKFSTIPGKGAILLKQVMIALSLGAIFVGLLLPFHGSGGIFFGIGLIILSCWLLLYHINIKNILSKGYPGYFSLAMLFGFSWLLITGILMIVGTSHYDAQLHGFFIGFVFSLIFGHAPAMLPRVLSGITLYHPLLYGWLLILNLALMLRIFADLSGMYNIYRYAGMLNGLVILTFLITMIILFQAYKKARDERY